MSSVRELIEEARRAGQDALGIANDPEALSLLRAERERAGDKRVSPPQGTVRMSKAELIEAVCGQANLTKADAGRALDAVMEEILTALKKARNVTLVGFGTFKVVHPKALGKRSPQTDAEIEFRPGAELKKPLK